MAGYSVSVISSDPIPNSIINQTDTITVTVAENPALAIIDKTATVDSANPVYIYKQGAAQSGYTVTSDTSVSGQITYTISKNGGWPSETQEITYKPDLTTTNPNVYSTKANMVVKVGESASFALAYLNLSADPTGFQWKNKVNGASDFSPMSDTTGAISGSTTRVVQLSNLTGLNSGQYKCAVTSPLFVDVYGTDTIDSSVSELYVIDPTLSADPSTPVIGSSVTITLEGVSSISQYITNYQWKKGSLTVGGNTPTLTINSWSSGDNGSYTCTITVFEDTIVSDALVLSAS